jgi:hypothetical protein
MKSLGDLLAKYQNIKPTDSIKKEAVIEVIRERFGIKLEKKDIALSSNTFYLRCSTKLKAEVFMLKKNILKDLKDILASNAPSDIR